MTTPETQDQLDSGGAYEIIRARLQEQSRLLSDKLNTLNQKRVEVFGSTQMQVMGRTRIRTENNCVPRDIKEFGEWMLFGYNVFVGMRAEVEVSDVFSLHHIEQTDEGFEYHPVPMANSFLSDPQFIRDFKELYRYYKDARLIYLRRIHGKRLAVFQTGRTLKDIRVFRWALDAQGKVSYLDHRGEKDNVFPHSHDFKWMSTTREQHVTGIHPHVSILEKVFVETIGGTLTVKIEDNTETGQGIYAEPVDDPNQSLADAQIEYAEVGQLILLKIRPYKENDWRYLVFNPLTEKVTRIDAIGRACVSLPEDHGIIFPGGYYLQSGETKIFDEPHLAEMSYKGMQRSPNGEDVLFSFFEPLSGRFALLSYNLIRKEVQNPIICHGYSVFDDGYMTVFRADDDTPSKVHPMQIWQTPYTSDEYAAQTPTDGSFIAKIGNAELVRGLAEAYSVKRMIDEQSPTRMIYEQLIAATNRVLDAFHWLDHEDIGKLHVVFRAVLDNAELIIDEFEKVQSLRKQANESLNTAAEAQGLLLESLAKRSSWTGLGEYVQHLTQVRTQRGQLISLREKRYMDLDKLGELEQQAVEAFDDLSQATVDYMLEQDAFAPYHAQLDTHLAGIEALHKTQEADSLETALRETGEGLDLLTEVLNDLQIDDSASRTRILEDIAEVYSKLNRAKAELSLKRKSLRSSEAVSEFGAQFKLFSQSVTSALNLADTPEKVDEQVSRLLVQLEELESRFSEFDEFLSQITDKREEVYSSFEGRKQSLLEERQRRALNLNNAATRILQGINRRLSSFENLDEQNAYFASDAMVQKVRDIIAQLHDIGDAVRAGDLESRLKSARDQAGRELRDRQEIFSDGGAVIALGKHRFSVNTQELDLTLLPRESNNGVRMAMHLTGTDFFQDIDDEQLNALQPYWEQSLVSETPGVYRAEYLAAELFFAAQHDAGWGQKVNSAYIADGLQKVVREFAADRYDEGYERGVHDVDAAKILGELLKLHHSAGLLRFAPATRALAQLFWAMQPEDGEAQHWLLAAKNLNDLQQLFDGSGVAYALRLRDVLAQAMGVFVEAHFGGSRFEDNEASSKPAGTSDTPVPSSVWSHINAQQAAEYLLEELKQGGQQFTTSGEAMRFAEGFWQHLESLGRRTQFQDTLNTLQASLAEQYALSEAWLMGFASQQDLSLERYREEAAVVVVVG